MPRRPRQRPDKLSKTYDRVRRRLQDTPIQAIATELHQHITSVQSAVEAGHLQADHAVELSNYVEKLDQRLPQNFGDRFRFDAGLIWAISEEWSVKEFTLSGMILPRTASEWGHQSLPLPSFKESENARVVDIILIPGGEALDDVDLLQYPLICHELGHNALFKNDAGFSNAFTENLEIHVQAIQRLSIADRGLAKIQSQKAIAKLTEVWTPVPTHFNWAHEIAVDTIALWACGPAYLATFHDVVDDPGVDPYQIGQSHPPYELRIKALCYAARRLDWSRYLSPLEDKIAGWRTSRWNANRTNEYAALAAPELMESCVDCSLQCCANLHLPQCTSAVLSEMESMLNKGEMPEQGSRLLIAAWMRYGKDESTYEDWERKAISAAIGSITW